MGRSEMADGSGPYGRIVLRELALEARRIQDVVDLLTANGFHVSETALAGAVAEEMHDTFVSSSNLVSLFGNWWFDTVAQVPRSHEYLLNYYNIYNDNRTYYENLTGNSLIAAKVDNPVLRDLGTANVRLATAIELLRSYIMLYSEDPLGIRSLYENDYGRLAADLATSGSATNYLFAGLA
jgi:hypothetical protein